MAVQRLRKSGSICHSFSVSVLCVLFMAALYSGSAAQEAKTVSGNDGGQQSDTVRPKLVHDGSLKVKHYSLPINTYRGIKEGQADSSRIDRDTPYFHEPTIHFRKDEDGYLRNKYEDGILTLYVSMNIFESQTLEAVKAYLQERKGVPKENLPFDANIQPLSVRGWFESSASEEIRSLLWDVTMSSRSGPDISVHFPMSSRDAANRFLSRLHPRKDGDKPHAHLLFRYSLQGDAIEVCTVNVSAETMTRHRRFQDLAGDASGDGRYVSRDQIADLMSEIGRHESISSHCRTESVAKQLRDEALKRLDGKVESVFTIDDLDLLTDGIRDDILADIVNTSKRIKAREEREQIQALSQRVRSGAMGFGLYLKAIVEMIPFEAEATVDMSRASGEAYQAMWDSLERVHDQLEWTGKRHLPKTVDVYRKEELRNALNSTIQVRHQVPVFAEDVRAIPISWKNWLADDEKQSSFNSQLEALSTRLAAAQEMIDALVARVGAPRLGNASRPTQAGVWVKGANFRIDAEANRELRDERGRALGGDIEIRADKDVVIRSGGGAIYITRDRNGNRKVKVQSDSIELNGRTIELNGTVTVNGNHVMVDVDERGI